MQSVKGVGCTHIGRSARGSRQIRTFLVAQSDTVHRQAPETSWRPRRCCSDQSWAVGAGSTPSCCIRVRESVSPQCSLSWPLATR